MNFPIPQKVNTIIEELMQHGYEAYVVGGCVRDMVLGREPEDWDITTSATPWDVKRIFRRTVDTGITHGTVTVLMDKEHYEVTTYRLDGEYEDNRHPKEVSFTSSLTEDLKRRDFTINAMAYNEKEGFIDLFGGMEDIQNKLIRCVGSAVERFSEDALRILRAVRFSAQLGFSIEEETLAAVQAKAANLSSISAERIRVELTKLLLSAHPDRMLDLYETGISKVVLPEFDQLMITEVRDTPSIYRLGEQTLRTVEAVAGPLASSQFDMRERTILRWTMLLHDIEKPSCLTVGKDNHPLFLGHQEKSANTAKRILRRLKFDNDTIDCVVHLIRWHDHSFELTPAGMRRMMSKIGKEYMPLLFEVYRADLVHRNPTYVKINQAQLKEAISLYQDVLDRGECVNLREMDINGNDLIALGMKPGRQIGELLAYLLEQVLDRPELNDKDLLLDLARARTN